jgi:hypothetical protein
MITHIARAQERIGAAAVAARADVAARRAQRPVTSSTTSQMNSTSAA